MPPHVDRSVDPRHQLRSWSTRQLGGNNKVGYLSRAFPDSNAQVHVDLIMHVGVGVNTAIGGIMVSLVYCWCLILSEMPRCRLRAEVPLSGPVASNGRQRAKLRGDWAPFKHHFHPLFPPPLAPCSLPYHAHHSFFLPVTPLVPLS